MNGNLTITNSTINNNQAVGGQGVDRALGIVHRLGPGGVGQPGGQRPLVVLGERRGVDVGAVTVRGGDGHGR